MTLSLNVRKNFGEINYGEDNEIINTKSINRILDESKVNKGILPNIFDTKTEKHKELLLVSLDKKDISEEQLIDTVNLNKILDEYNPKKDSTLDIITLEEVEDEEADEVKNPVDEKIFTDSTLSKLKDLITLIDKEETIKNFDSEIDKLENIGEILENDVDKKRSEISNQKESIMEFDTSMKILEAARKELQSSVNKKTTELVDEEGYIKKLDDNIKTFETVRGQSSFDNEESITEFDNKMETLEAAREELVNDINKKKLEITNVKKSIEEMDSQINISKDIKKDLAMNVGEKMNEIVDEENVIKKFDDKMETLKAAREELVNDINKNPDKTNILIESGKNNILIFNVDTNTLLYTIPSYNRKTLSTIYYDPYKYSDPMCEKYPAFNKFTKAIYLFPFPYSFLLYMSDKSKEEIDLSQLKGEYNRNNIYIKYLIYDKFSKKEVIYDELRNYINGDDPYQFIFESQYVYFEYDGDFVRYRSHMDKQYKILDPKNDGNDMCCALMPMTYPEVNNTLTKYLIYIYRNMFKGYTIIKDYLIGQNIRAMDKNVMTYMYSYSYKNFDVAFLFSIYSIVNDTFEIEFGDEIANTLKSNNKIYTEYIKVKPKSVGRNTFKTITHKYMKLSRPNSPLELISI